MKFLRIAALLALIAAGRAAPIERDLGEGFVYFRVHVVPADLPSENATHRRPCVLDLRYVDGDADATVALGGWLRFHATTRTPVFVLVNDATSSALMTAFADREGMTGVLVIGSATLKPEPDIGVRTSPAEERRAYEALESGATVASLTTDNPNKQRNDEASLSRERPSDTTGDDPGRAPSTVEKAAPPLTDGALQRALQLHRALRAMKKL